MDNSLIVVYAAPLLLTMMWYLQRHFRLEKKSREVHFEAKEAGLLEPASLHPTIDLTRCLGCGACVRACPEYPQHTVLGLIDNKAHLVAPTECIGHGACKSACPVDAITLVFGTAIASSLFSLGSLTRNLRVRQFFPQMLQSQLNKQIRMRLRELW